MRVRERLSYELVYGDRMLTDCHGNATRNQRTPSLPNGQGPRQSSESKESTGSSCPFFGHVRQALSSYKPSGEYPNVGRWHLEKLAGDLVYSVANDMAIQSTLRKIRTREEYLRRVDAIRKCTKQRTAGSTYDLSPELRLGGSSKQVTGLEVLH